MISISLLVNSPATGHSDENLETLKVWGSYKFCENSWLSREERLNLNISVEMVTALSYSWRQWSVRASPQKPSSTQAEATGSRTAQRQGADSKEMAPGRKGWAGNLPLPWEQGCWEAGCSSVIPEASSASSVCNFIGNMLGCACPEMPYALISKAILCLTVFLYLYECEHAILSCGWIG